METWVGRMCRGGTRSLARARRILSEVYFHRDTNTKASLARIYWRPQKYIGSWYPSRDRFAPPTSLVRVLVCLFSGFVLPETVLKNESNSRCFGFCDFPNRAVHHFTNRFVPFNRKHDFLNSFLPVSVPELCTLVLDVFSRDCWWLVLREA